MYKPLVSYINLQNMITLHFQPAIRNSRPAVIQAPPRPVMSHGLRPIAPLMHPAPLPEISQVLQQQNPGWKQSPPKPKLKISRLKTGKYNSIETTNFVSTKVGYFIINTVYIFKFLHRECFLQC